MNAPDDAGLSQAQAQMSKLHAVEIAAFPTVPFVDSRQAAAETRYPHCEVVSSRKRTYRDKGILRVETRLVTTGGNYANVYSVPGAVTARAEHYAETMHSPCGCGHSGIRNIPDSDYYTCTTEGCDVRVTRAEVER